MILWNYYKSKKNSLMTFESRLLLLPTTNRLTQFYRLCVYIFGWLIMDDRLNLGSDVRELKLGSSFNGNNSRTSTSFHTLKCKYNKQIRCDCCVGWPVLTFPISFFPDDFKPTSLDLSKVATLDVSSNNQVTVSVPHLGKKKKFFFLLIHNNYAMEMFSIRRVYRI